MSDPALAAVQRWTLRAAAFALPLVYSPLTYDGYVLPKLLVARAVVIVLLALQAFRVLSTRRLAVRRTPLDLAWLVFLASAVLSTVLAGNANVAIFGTYGRYDGLLTLLTYAALFWLSVQVIRYRTEARTVLRVLLAGGYACAAIAIFQSVHDSLQSGSLAPAFGTLGNPNVLGGYLAMVLALAVGEAIEARLPGARVLAVNAIVLVGLALLLTLSRSAWIASVAGVLVVVLATGPLRVRVAIIGSAAVAIALIVFAAGAIGNGPELEQRVAARVLALNDPGSSRFGIWTNSMTLIASRPITGYGPDNVGLVFPQFQTGDWGLAAGHIRQPIDKTHAEVLQVAATQGMIGLAAYLFLLAAFLRMFWSGRRMEFAIPIFAGWLAYELALQANFTALASALPFWIFAGAAIVMFDKSTGEKVVERANRVVPWTVIPVLVAAFAAGVVVPFLADANLKAAVDDDLAGQTAAAAQPATLAARLAPYDGVEATEVGNIAFEQGHWAAAREAYREAARLGTFNPLVYRNLALADQRLGLLGEARTAAEKAVFLDPYDPANQALLAQFGSQ